MRFSRCFGILAWLVLLVPGCVIEQVASLKRYNQPEFFLTDAKNLDLRQIVWESDRVFTRPDGVGVRIKTVDSMMGKVGKYYLEDLTHSESPYDYRNIYDENGVLLYKTIKFYGEELFGLYECKDGKCAISSSPYNTAPTPIIPIEQTREALRKKTRIDLYDKSGITQAHYFTDDKSKPYYILTIYGHYKMLIDAETGKVIYKNGSMFEIWDIPESARFKSEQIIKKHMEKDQTVYYIHRKQNTWNPDRFYEVFVKNPDASLISFFLDHKKEKILYRSEAMLYQNSPYVQIWDEYQQYLKMREAEEKPAFLERYNQPEIFLADVKNLDLEKIVWKSNREAVSTRPDGENA